MKCNIYQKKYTKIEKYKAMKKLKNIKKYKKITRKLEIKWKLDIRKLSNWNIRCKKPSIKDNQDGGTGGDIMTDSIW